MIKQSCSSLLALTLSLYLGASAALASPHADAKRTVGRIEHALILPEGIQLSAKMDTGAYRASLHAQNIVYFTKDQQKWVRFTVKWHDHDAILERPLLSTTKIKIRNGEASASKEHNPPSQLESRPVVMLNLCIDGQRLNIETNLANRSNFKLPVLIGRRAMIKYGMIVDPSQEFIGTTSCKETSKANS